MKKIVIIGSPGAGKSTLARQLGPLLDIKVFHLDRLFWYPGWEGKARDTRIDILQHLTGDRQWIIEGTYLQSSEPRLEAADTIVFLDVSCPRCLYQIAKRHRETKGKLRRDIPQGCTDKVTIPQLLKVLRFHFREKKPLRKMLESYHSKNIVTLRTSQEVKNFLSKHGPKTYNEPNTSIILTK